ncbi:MAG TPA: YdeI/OmpD-associated family protein [Archangium sp.]
MKPIAFKTTKDLDQWLQKHHATETELWIRMYKKASGVQSVDWNDCVETVLAWGWIDGIRKSLDEVSFVQRFTPRKAKSTWSKKNCGIVEKLIAEGRMQPSGLAHVESAKADGRWERAYAGPATAEVPEDFLAALKKNAAAKKFYATLNKTNLFSIYHRLHTARTPELRAKRITAIVSRLAEGKAFH